jgi:N-methylhydantoinase A
MDFRISVDTGGTFTDVVVVDRDGTLHIGKALTNTARAFDGISEGLEQVAAEIGVPAAEILRGAAVFTYGTTRATNAIVEGKTARTAFFTTEGFPDVLLLREGGKLDPFRQMHYPPAYVPRWLTFELAERIDAEGGVHLPLDESTVLDAIERSRSLGAEAVAVCLLWSIVNPAHELRVAELLEEHWPGLPYTVSHLLNPIIREYRRASSTAIDASLKPLMQEYLSTMEADLRAAGFAGHLFVATSSGGAWRPDQVVERPIYSVGSGPSMAPVAARTYGRAELGAESGDLIVCDTGGTTFDVGLVSGGTVTTTAETWLGGRFTGHITGIRSVDVKSIGAGGGSVVWIDGGGLLRVGPHSAGASPGPACYGRGGVEPTVTDAAVVLGWIDPDYFLGGRLHLDADAAHEALARSVAPALGMEVRQAAAAALTIASENIVGAIREITIAQGVDPREVSMIAGGGASGLNVIPIARELGCRRVLVPSTAGALSACGALYADVVSDFSRSLYTESHTMDVGQVDGVLAAVDEAAGAFLDDLADVQPTGLRKEFLVEARYRAQVWELEVGIPERLVSRDGVAALEEAFHAAHERVFAVREPGQYLECLLWKVRATAELEKPALRARSTTGGPSGPGGLQPAGASPSPTDSSPAYFSETGPVEVPRYDGGALPAGARIEGPAIVREPTSTLVVYPGSAVTVTALGNYMVEVGE